MPLPTWRKTGRKANARHFEGLEVGAYIEFVGYNDQNRQQGRILGCLAETEPCHSRERGMAAQVHVLAIEDEYFEYWHNQTFGEYDVRLLTPVHFCEVPIASCQGQTRYRNPLHVDVFRVLSLEDTATLGWLTDVHRSRFDGPGSPGAGGAGDGAGLGAGAVAATPGAGGQGQERGAGVEPGAPGIAGLAAALGDRDRGENQARLGALKGRKDGGG